MIPFNLLSLISLFSLLATSFQLKRVLVQNSYPMVICIPGHTGLVSFKGIEIDMFNDISSYFGVTTGDWEYECVDSESAIYDKLTANPSDYLGGFGALRVSLNRQLAGFTFSGPTLHTGLSVLVSSQENEWIFLQVCTIGTAAALVVCAIVMAILQYFFEAKEYPFEDYLWNAFASMFFVTAVRLRTTPSRVLMIVYWFVILIFTSAYAANLTAVLTLDQGSQKIGQVSDLEQKVIKTPQAYMTSLPLYGIRPLKLTDMNENVILNDLIESSVDGYAFEDSIVQIFERKNCQFAKKVRLFHPFNYIMVFSTDIDTDTMEQVNLGLETALEGTGSLTRIHNFLEEELKLYLTCVREAPIDEDKMLYADILHLGEILGVALVIAILLHLAAKTRPYKRFQAYLVKKNILNYMDESQVSQRKVGDDLIIDNLKQVTKSSMESLTSGINERLDQMDEKVGKFYDILINNNGNSEMNMSRDQFGFDEKSRSFSDDSIDKDVDEHPIGEFRSDIPLEGYTPMQSPNQSLLRVEYEAENEDRNPYKGR